MKAHYQTYTGLFLLALAALMLEILITRIFSVTTWYHFAFLAVSVAMLGMTVGAIVVYLNPKYFQEDKTDYHLGLFSLLFSISSLLAVLVHLYCPFLLFGADATIVITFSLFMAIPFLLLAFALSGIAISLALTRFPAQINKLYAADLCGAALGCLLLVGTLQVIDGVSAVFFTAAVSSLSAFFFSVGLPPGSKLKATTLVTTILLFAFVGIHTKLVADSNPIFPIVWTKGIKEPPCLYQRWNSFSRIRVWGDPNKPEEPVGYGLGTGLSRDYKVRELYIDIDGGACTNLIHYDGNPQTVGHLFYEMTNIAHYMRPNSKVLVIGVGGGKDILSALIFNQKSVTGVEINANIIRASTKDYADFTGHYNNDPRVSIVNDEARSYVARSKEKFDIIQASMIDTWAASASGAFALAENSLYTIEAWRTFLEHLTDRGVVTMHRWYHKDTPAEFYRLTALAAEALLEEGIKNPRDHILVARNSGAPAWQGDAAGGVGTILVSKTPFSKEDITRFNQLCKKMGFEITLTPSQAADGVLARLASGKELDKLSKELPYNMMPPSDDNPFFFQTISLAHILDPSNYVQGRNTHNIMAAAMLLVTLMVVLLFSIYCFRIPFLKTENKSALAGSIPLFSYFFLIGAGFMFVEISQVQRLSIFLGHPTFGLSVVLFALLLSTGIGSLTAAKIWQKNNIVVPALLILSVLAIFGIASPFALHYFADASTFGRIFCAFLLLFPVGIVLGMPFPMGMTQASRSYPSATPWFWGINGAASVCGSVLTVVTSMWAGITTSYWLGFLTYAAALYAYRCTLKPAGNEGDPSI